MKWQRKRILCLFYFVSVLFLFFVITSTIFIIPYLETGTKKKGTIHPENPQQKPEISLWRTAEGVSITRNNYNDRIQEQLKWSLEQVQPTTVKRILLVYDRTFIHTRYTEEGFRKECPRLADYCEFIHEQRTSSVDAVMLEYPYLYFTRGVLNTLLWNMFDYFRKFFGMSHIKRIILVYESNMYLGDGRTVLSGDDILVSYWKNADIVQSFGFGKWIYYESNPKNISIDHNYAEGKHKLAAIFVSNCGHVANERMAFVNELQKYIPVDIYGKCGTLECSKEKNSCFDLLKKDYKFYLAFENANCREYITEKFFTNALMNNVVPVVLGAHPDDYAAIAPRNSYIHVEDFKDIESLANYLKFLDENDDEYNKHFQWIGTGEFMNSKIHCRICGMLHYADIVPHPRWEKPLYWQGESGTNDDGINGPISCLPRGKQRWKN